MSDDLVELRGMSPKGPINVVDAVAISRKVSRIEQVNEILAEWAKARVHESTLVLRCTRGEGSNGEAMGKQRGDS